MRREATPAEHILWQILRAKRFSGYKFRRQVPLEWYIGDFVCFSARLIIEVDGGQHAESATDGRRDAFLRSLGFRVLRIWNNDVFENELGVSEAVLAALRLPPLPSAASRLPPSPARGEGFEEEK
jgi:very-short-patch-repair endonuclease